MIDQSQPFQGFVDGGQEKVLCSQTILQKVWQETKNAVPLHRQSVRALIQKKTRERTLKSVQVLIKERKDNKDEKIVFGSCSYAQHDYDICRE